MEQLIDFNKEGEGFQKNDACKIILQYGNEVIIFPVNPESIKINGKSLNERKEVIGLGEINIIRDMGLKTIAFSSFFPFRTTQFPYVTSSLIMYRPIQYYVSLMNRIRDKKVPIRIIVPSMLINTLVSIELFDHWEEFGDEDRWFDIEVVQWKDYSPLEFKLEQDGSITKIPSRTDEVNKFTLFSKIRINGKIFSKFPFGAIGGKSLSITTTTATTNELDIPDVPGAVVNNIIGIIKLKDPVHKLYYIYDSNEEKALGWVHEASLTKEGAL